MSRLTAAGRQGRDRERRRRRAAARRPNCSPPRARRSRSSTATATPPTRLRGCAVRACKRSASADVSKQAEVQQAVNAAREQYGNADILFNHAGTLIVKPFLDIEESEWDWLMGVNVKSMFLMTQAVLPQMLEKGRAASSARRRFRRCATPGEVLYDATRRVPHVRAGDRGRVSRPRHSLQRARAGVHPHAARDARTEGPAGDGRRRDRGGDRGAAGRLCEPSEVAAAALFLASDESSFVNGTHLFVDNCFSAV